MGMDVTVSSGTSASYHMQQCQSVASFPVPRPAFRRYFIVLSSDEKLGVGLGTRLVNLYKSC